MPYFDTISFGTLTTKLNHNFICLCYLYCIFLNGCDSKKNVDFKESARHLSDSLCFFRPFRLDEYINKSKDIYRKYSNRKDLPPNWTGDSEFSKRVVAWYIEVNSLNYNPFKAISYVDKKCLEKYGIRIKRLKAFSKNDWQNFTKFIRETELRYGISNSIDVISNDNITAWEKLIQKYSTPLLNCNAHPSKDFIGNKRETAGSYFMTNHLILSSIIKKTYDANKIYFSLGSGASNFCDPIDIFLEYQINETEDQFIINRTI